MTAAWMVSQSVALRAGSRELSWVATRVEHWAAKMDAQMAARREPHLAVQ